MSVHAGLLRDKFDHLDQGVDALNIAFDQAQRTGAVPDLELLHWKAWAAGWKRVYYDNRPADVKFASEDDWKVLSLEERDFLDWRARYAQLTGTPPPPYSKSKSASPAVNPSGVLGGGLALPLGALVGAVLLLRGTGGGR